MPQLAPGDIFADHRIDGIAGRGGMGVVYRATELGLERTVALKVIAPALAQEEDFRTRFVAESRAAASIEHPSVVPIYHAGERDGVLYIAMRFIDGPDLRALVRAQGPLEPERAAHVVAQVAGALDAAHRHGLVHRDVKPANVLLGEDDHAYLTDFGLTKRSATSDGGGLSRAGGWVGTLGYVAPEQIRGERVDARTDVYALGCVLVYALTGQAPYLRDSDEATLWAHLNAPPPSESVPAEFEGLVARALAKDPSDRYQSAGDLGRAALRAAGRSATAVPEGNVARGAAAPLGGPAGATRPWPGGADAEGETRPSPPTPTAPAARRRTPPRPLALAAAALLAVAAIVLAVVLLAGDGGRGAGDGAATTPAAPAARRAAIDVERYGINTRPNALTIAGGGAWALSNRTGEIAVVDADDGDDVARVEVGRGGSSLAAGFDSVWVTKETTSTVLRINATTHRRVAGGAVEVAVPGRNVAVAAGAGAVWVAVRNRSPDARGPESVVRIDPSSGAQRTITVAGGVQDLAVGAGAVWVTNRFSATVTRIRTRDGRQDRVPVGAGPRGIAVGAGAVWVASALGDALTRINPRSLRTTTVDLGAIPERIAVGGGSVWVTAKEAGRLLRVDARTRRVAERIETGYRPYALDVTRGRAVWVTLLDRDGVVRVRFHRAAS